MSKLNWRLPLLIAGVLALGMYLGAMMSKDMGNNQVGFSFPFKGGSAKLQEIVKAIEDRYVDPVKLDSLEDIGITSMLESLDPHSSYVSAKEFKGMNESLEGNFEGIGVEFHLLNDTIFVVNAIVGGPSEALGIRSGDKIVQIDGKAVAGKNIKNSDVTHDLRGPSGTKVKVGILRGTSKKIIDYTITRAEIPLNSVDVSYMIDATTAYIKISKFSATTEEEFVEAIAVLKERGAQNLILDLRGNGGGYLSAATGLADQFLGNKALIVYTQGHNQPRTDYFATAAGEFENGKLMLLVDEGSASASEIVTGAIQDLDRGTIVGRRTFGKGLVQDQMQFNDGSALRLTIARYFTPSGRCIQKSYKKGYELYNEELSDRYARGELQHADSIKQDTVKYTTKNGRIVYGGGGIKPDVFVALDTTDFSAFYALAASTGSINEFAYNYADKHRDELKKYADFEDFNQHFFISDATYNSLVDTVLSKEKIKTIKGIAVSQKLIKLQLKALIARQQWTEYGYYKVMQQRDEILAKAVALLKQ